MMDSPIFLFSPEEEEQIIADARELQKEYDDLAAWLKSPEGRSWGEQQIKEAVAIAEEFSAEVKAGKFDLTPAELEQLRQGSVVRKCHPIKRGGQGDG